MDLGMNQEEIAAALRGEAAMAQRVCGFITACNSEMEEEASHMLNEIADSDDPDNLKQFIYGLAGLTAGCLTSLGFLMGLRPEVLLERFALMNEVSPEESMEQAAAIIAFWRDQPDQ